jgi:hypothetical protein
MFAISDSVKLEVRREQHKTEFEDVVVLCLEECHNTVEELEVRSMYRRLFPLMQVGCQNDRLIVLLEVREVLLDKYKRRSRLRNAAMQEFISVMKDRMTKCIGEEQLNSLAVIYYEAKKVTKNDREYVEKFEAFTEQVRAFPIY